MYDGESTSLDGPKGLRHWLARQRGCVARDFWRARCASVAIESAAVVSVLVVVAGGLMEVFSSVYMNETMNRAARAAARAIALSPSVQNDAAAVQTLACEAIRRELDLPGDLDCSTAWTMTVDTGLTTDDLLNGASPDSRNGDMVRIHIAWHRQPWSFDADPSVSDPSVSDSSGTDSSGTDSAGAGASGGDTFGHSGPDGGPLETQPIAVMPEPLDPPDGPPVQPAPVVPDSKTLRISVAVARSEPDQLTP